MELSQSDKYLIVVGIIFCIALAVLSPYIASGDPDGLEKSAEDAASWFRYRLCIKKV